jgi:hypothetical protein
MNDQKTDLIPVSSTTENVLDLLSLISSAVPWFGGPVSNFFGGVSSGRKFERVKEVLEDITEELREFESEASQKYVTTEDFEDLLEETLRRVAHERNEEKRRIYRDFLLSMIESPGEPYDEQIRFLRTLEELQPAHIIVIRALMQEPSSTLGISGSPINTLTDRMPDIPRNQIEDLIAQLNDLRVTNVTSLHTMMTASGAQDLRHSITPFGKRFVQFILD